MNAKATIERVLELAGPVMQPEKYRRYLSGLSPAHLAAKLKDLEESQTRTGRGYCPLRKNANYENRNQSISSLCQSGRDGHRPALSPIHTDPETPYSAQRLHPAGCGERQQLPHVRTA
jgi:hypothetical protein